MKNTHILNLSIGLVLSYFSAAVWADNARGFYIGASFAAINEPQDVETSTKARAGEILAGYKYNGLLGIEARVGKGIKDSSSEFYLDSKSVQQSGALSRKLDNYKSVYYKPELINDEAKLYMLIGYTSLNSTLLIKNASAKEITNSDTKYSGASYGIGVGFVLGEQLNLNIEYKVLCKEFNDKPDDVSVSLDYRF